MAIYNGPSLLFRLKGDQSSYITAIASSGKGRDITVTIAMAMVASTLIKLPTDITPDINSFMNANGYEEALDFIDVVNKLVPIDTAIIMSLTEKLYKARYEAAYMPFQAFSIDQKQGIACIFGLSKHIPENILDKMQNNAFEITTYYDRLCEVLCALKTDGEIQGE